MALKEITCELIYSNKGLCAYTYIARENRNKAVSSDIEVTENIRTLRGQNEKGREKLQKPFLNI